ncbi:hypothetical protein SynTAK9802_01707 [Synechococcus sp. TAK9802]|nr:hypothetical protein SynTAK9802_01707 [Synechococcus sp. TAK9802]
MPVFSWHAGGQEFESPWLHSTKAQLLAGFFYCQCAAMIPLGAPCWLKKMKRCKLWAPTWPKELGWAPEVG